MRWIAVLAGLCAALLGVPGGAVAATAPVAYTLPAGFTVSNFGVAVDGAGAVWFGAAGPTHPVQGGSSTQPTPSIARLDPAAAQPGTSNGVTTYPTPDPPAPLSCCANQLRSLTYNAVDDRLYYVRSDGGYGTFLPSAAQPGTSTGMTSSGLPGYVDLWDVAPSKDGGAWFTEHSASNQSPYYYGDRIAYYHGAVTEGPNVAIQNGNTALNDQRYDAEPSGIAVDANGRPWFGEENAGLPGYRIATYSGTGSNYAEYLLSPCENGAAQPCSGSDTGRGVSDVAIASDGKVWFTNNINKKIGFFDPATLSFTQFTTASIDPSLSGGAPLRITAAPDGTIWVTNSAPYASGNALIRVVPGDATHPPTATFTPLGSNDSPLGLTASGSDLWFTTVGGTLDRLPGVIGAAVTPGGGTTTTPTPGGGTTTTTTTPLPPATTPASVRPPVVLSTTIGIAHADPPQTGNGAINTNQICVGPPQARCSMIYLVQTHEYVAGYPSRVGAAKAKRKHRPQVLATKSVVLKGGQSKRITITLNKLGQRILKRAGRVKVDFVISQKQANGRTKVISTKVLTVKARKKRR